MNVQVERPQDTFLARSYKTTTFVYYIDIVGTCNLGCVSCPVGNTVASGANRGSQPKGFMPYERFAAILEKIQQESPSPSPVISLYNWGEPLLHPDIGRIVRLVRGSGWYCSVSTNLNQGRFLEDLVVAEPSHIKISVSGFSQSVYGRTHNKGNVEVVKANMRRLRTLMDLHDKHPQVLVGYHDYIGNGGDELRAMEALAEELHFDLRHKIARLAPVEKLLPLMREGVEPAVRDRDLFDLLLVKPYEWAQIAQSEGASGSCVMREQEMAINFDGTVSLCCNVFDYSNNIAPDFLAVPHRDLQQMKDRHSVCGPCMAAAFPRSCGLDAHPAIQNIARSRAIGSKTSALTRSDSLLGFGHSVDSPTETTQRGAE